MKRREKNPFFSLIESLKMLPGVGEKTAMRFAVHLMKERKERVLKMAQEIIDLKEKLKLCPECGYISSEKGCDICDDPSRERTILCVVEDIPSVIAMEKAKIYNGLYHVLHGLLSPFEGEEAIQSKIKPLLERIERMKFREIIIATNPTVEGDATAFYLRDKIKGMSKTKITKLISGIPHGGYIDLMDDMTIKSSFNHRVEF